MRQHMSRADRAKQFAPFAALRGLDRALRRVEREPQPRRELMPEELERLDHALHALRPGDRVAVTFYNGFEEETRLGTVTSVAPLAVDGEVLDALYEIKPR